MRIHLCFLVVLRMFLIIASLKQAFEEVSLRSGIDYKYALC
ncbi:MAG: hypothetical protein ACRY3E_05595 [Candidatus Lariskella arthropodorum]